MKKLLIYLIGVIILFIGIDLLVGVWLHKRIIDAHGEKIFYVSQNSDIADVIIAGSSRANHHYVSEMLEDSLGLKVYNLGLDGMDVTYNYPLLKRVFEKTSPKVLILEVGGSLEDGNNYMVKNLKFLASEDSTIRNLLIKSDDKNKYLLKSNLYKCSGKLLDLYKYFYTTYNNRHGGYERLDKVWKSTKQPETAGISQDRDPFILECLGGITSLAKSHNTKLIFCWSPRYTRIKGKNVMEEYCKENGIDYLSWENDELFLSHPEYFADPAHLNHEGATIFTAQFAHKLKNICKE